MKQQNRSFAVNEELDQILRRLFLDGIAGDEDSYRLFLEKVAEILRSFLVSIMSVRQRSEVDVEDLIQDVLFSIHRKRGFYRSEFPLIQWIHAIARYRFFDLLRSKSRRIATVEWVPEFDHLIPAEPARAEESNMNDLLRCLNEKERTLLQLAKVEELSYAEIAKKSGMTVSAVKVSIHRSLKKLRIR